VKVDRKDKETTIESNDIKNKPEDKKKLKKNLLK